MTLLFVISVSGAARLHWRRIHHLHETAVASQSAADAAGSQAAHRHRLRSDGDGQVARRASPANVLDFSRPICFVSYVLPL